MFHSPGCGTTCRSSLYLLPRWNLWTRYSGIHKSCSPVLDLGLDISDQEFDSDKGNFEPCETKPLVPPDLNEQQEISPPAKSAWSEGPQGSYARGLIFTVFLLLIYIIGIRKSPSAVSPIPAKSAWLKGPPPSATTPSPRSQSPAPSTPVTQTHSRRSSTLGQAVPVNDGVSVSRPNMGAPKQSESLLLTFACSLTCYTQKSLLGR